MPSPAFRSRAAFLTAGVTGVLAVVGAVAAALAPVAGAAPRATFTKGFTDGIYEQPSVAGYWLDKTASAGGEIVLLAVPWDGIAAARPSGDESDPANPAYHWGTLDGAVRAATARGLAVAFSVAPNGGPAWADGPQRPRSAQPGTWRPNVQAFAAFARAVALRYSGTFNPGDGVLPHVRYYQAWSEPNLDNHLTPQWVRKSGRWVAESPVVYRNLLNGFYAAVKSVNASDQVITGGTAPFGDPPGGQRMQPAEFVRELLCLHGQALALERCPDPAHFDILAHHPYAVNGPFAPALNADDVSVADFGKLKRPLAVALRTGRALPRAHKRLWVTEFSWDSNPPDPHGVPIAEQARWIEEAFYELWREGVGTITWFNVVDQPPVPDYGSTYQSGVYYLNGRPKPAAQAFLFPFVVERSARGRWTVWGIAPGSGTVLIQRRSSSRRWTPVMRLRAYTAGVFTRDMTLKGRPLMRASLGTERSLTFRPS